MKILYIGDNRNRPNYGCRGTSAALSEMIGEENVIVRRISGRLTKDLSFVYIPLWDGWLNRFIYKNKDINNFVRKAIRKCPDSIRQRCDFLSKDFEKSIELIKKYSQVNREYREINLDLYSYDAIVINGEGDMIMTSPERRSSLYYLLFAYWAKKKEKKVFFVNAMFSDCPATGRNENTVLLTRKIFSKCDAIIVRDPVSYRYAKEVIGLEECKYVPDALFSWSKYYHEKEWIRHIRDILPFGYESDKELTSLDMVSHEYICVSGSSAAAWNPSEATERYIDLVKALKKSFHSAIYIVPTCSGDAFLEEVARKTHTIFVPIQISIIAGLNLLAHAGLFVSGRYHPSIMASLGGTPCIFLGANSHKNMGLQEMLEYDVCKEYHACPTEDDIEEICKEAVILMNDVELRKKIREVSAKRAIEARQITEYIR